MSEHSPVRRNPPPAPSNSGLPAPSDVRLAPTTWRAPVDDEINLSPYIQILANWWMVIVGVAILAGVVTFGLLSTRPVTYEASTTLLVVQAKEGDNSFGGIAASNALAAGASRIIFDNNALAQEIIRRFGLDKPPYSYSPRQFLRSAVRQEEVRGANVILLHVTLLDPQLAANVANALAEGAVAIAYRISQHQSVALRDHLNEQVAAAREALNLAEQRLKLRREQVQLEVRKKDVEAALSQRAGLLPLISNIEGERARLARAEQELSNQQRILDVPRQVDSSKALIELANQDPKPSADSPSIAGLNLSNPSVNPVYEALQYQVALSRSRLAGLERELAGLQSRGFGAEDLGQMKGLYADELELIRLTSEYDLYQKLYGDLALAYEKAKVRAADKAALLQVIDEAVAPDEPQPRGRLKASALSMAGAGAVTSLLVLAVAIGRRRQ